MSFKFNGTTVVFPGTPDTARVVSITENRGNNKIDITGAATTEHQYEAGLDDVELTFEVLLGNSTGLVRGATGQTTITWSDGGAAFSLATTVVVGISKTGSIDGATVTSVTIVPSEV